MESHTVYCHRNKTNNKRYIGITSQPVNQRWRNGTNYYGNKYFHRAIQKYGWDGFYHEIVAVNLTKEEAEIMEIDLIKKYKTTNRKFGYNIENGGNSKGKHSKETLKKMSESQIGEKNHMFGKKGALNPNSRKVICLTTNKIFDSVSEANDYCGIKGVSGCCRKKRNSCGKLEDGTPLFWMYYDEYKKLSEVEIDLYIKERMKVYKKNSDKSLSNNYNSKSITCINTGEVFECMKFACEKYNISSVSLSNAVNGKTRYAGKCNTTGENLKWRFTDGEYLWVSKGSKKKRVLCITTGEIFDSVKSASQKYNIYSSQIIGCCKGTLKTAKGLSWKYVV